MRAVPLALIFAVLTAAAVQAQTPPPTRIAPPPPPAEVPAPPAVSVPGPPVLTPDICQQLAARAVPPAGYQSGVDVYGRPVAPADLPGSSAPMPPVTTEIELGRVATGRSATGGLIRGYVTVEPNGTVLLNGQKLPREQEYGLFDLCRQQRLIP